MYILWQTLYDPKISLLSCHWLVLIVYPFFNSRSHFCLRQMSLQVNKYVVELTNSLPFILWMLYLRVQRGFGVFWDYCAIRNPMVVFNWKRSAESHFRRWFIWANKRKQTKDLSSSLPVPLRSHINAVVFSSALHLWGLSTKSHPV